MRHIQSARFCLHFDGVEQVVGLPLSRHTLLVEDDGLRDKNEAGENLTAWNVVERLETTSSHVFICTGAMNAYAVARERVEEGDPDAFLEAVRQRLG